MRTCEGPPCRANVERLPKMSLYELRTPAQTRRSPVLPPAPSKTSPRVRFLMGLYLSAPRLQPRWGRGQVCRLRWLQRPTGAGGGGGGSFLPHPPKKALKCFTDSAAADTDTLFLSLSHVELQIIIIELVCWSVMILVSFPSLAAFGSSAADGAGRVPAGSPAREGAGGDRARGCLTSRRGLRSLSTLKIWGLQLEKRLRFKRWEKQRSS